MKVLNDLQKDLDSRKYKSNPFEKKYVDLTTSSCVASSDDNLGLEHLSKTIRTRADIINCQVAHLVKETSNVSVNFSADVVLISTKLKSKEKSIEKSDDFHDFFTDEGYLNDDSISHSQIKTYSESMLPENVMSAKLPYLEELLRSLKTEKLNKIISPFLPSRSKLSNLSEIIEQKCCTAGSDNTFSKDDFVQHCSTEALLSNTRSCVDSNLLQRHLDGHEKDTTCSLHKFLRYIKPFSFAAIEMLSDNDREEIEDDNRHIIRKDEVKETASMRLNSENSVMGNLDYNDDDKIHDYDDIAPYNEMDITNTDMYYNDVIEKDISFIHGDIRVLLHTDEVKVASKSMKVQGANFMQLSNSDDTDESDRENDFSESCVEKVKRETSIDLRKCHDKKYNDNDGKFEGKSLLSKMRTRINQTNLRKTNTSKCNNVGSVNGHHKGTSSFGSLSLEGVINKMPTLLAFHTSQLNHDNAFAALPALSNRTVVRVNNANELLLAIPPLSTYSCNGRTMRRDGNRQTKDMICNEERQTDSIQTLSTLPIEIVSLKDPKLALCLPSFVANEDICQNNISVSKEKDTWSPLGLGFGFDQNLRILFEILRPEEFGNWQQNLHQREQQRDERDEWEGVANLFLPNVEDHNHREKNWGSNCSEDYKYEGCYSEEQTEVSRELEDFDVDEFQHENDVYFNRNCGVDNWSDEMSDKERTSTPAAMHTPKNFSIDGLQPSFLLIDRKRQHDIEDQRCNLRNSSLNSPLDNAETLRQNINICKNIPFITPASQRTSVLTVISHPLLPVSRIQQLLRGVMSSPPGETLLRLDHVIPQSLIKTSYPTLGLQEGKLRYTKRVFVSLIFLADGYNRQQIAIAGNTSQIGNVSSLLKKTSHSTTQMLLSSSEPSTSKDSRKRMHENYKSVVESEDDSAIQEQNNIPTVIINFR